MLGRSSRYSVSTLGIISQATLTVSTPSLTDDNTSSDIPGSQQIQSQWSQGGHTPQDLTWAAV